LGQARDQFRLVPSADHELFLAGSKPLNVDLALVALGVYDVDARRRDSNVVDVGSTPGHTAIVQHQRPWTSTHKESPQGLLAQRTGLPRLLVLGLVLQPQ